MSHREILNPPFQPRTPQLLMEACPTASHRLKPRTSCGQQSPPSQLPQPLQGLQNIHDLLAANRLVKMNPRIPKMDLLLPKMDLLLPKMDLLLPKMDLTVPKMDLPFPKMDLRIPKMPRSSPLVTRPTRQRCTAESCKSPPRAPNSGAVPKWKSHILGHLPLECRDLK
jgi:hypothetical protein